MKNLIVKPDNYYPVEIETEENRHFAEIAPHFTPHHSVPVKITVVQPEKPRDIARLAGEAFTAIKAQQDEYGNNIARTYANREDFEQVKFDVKDLKAKNTIENAEKLSSAKNISLSGDAEGSVAFDGSSDANISVNVKNADKATHDSEGNVITENYATKNELQDYIRQEEMTNKIQEVEQAAVYGATMVINSLAQNFATAEDIDSLF